MEKKAPSSKSLVIVAMSGGVDSSVAAYLLKEQGFKVIGLSFELWDRRDLKNLNTCCSRETIEIARRVAEKLDIEHCTIDTRDAFYKHVIENFCSSYIAGTTPNPCILCNKLIKFKFLLKKAEETGAQVIATGHYARVEKPQNPEPAYRTGRPRTQNPDRSRFLLKKGLDPKKDQSYVLYVMTQNELSRTVFPLGELRKEKTKTLARKLGLASALRPESQDICFVGNGNYADFVRDYALGINPETAGQPDALKPGPIVDTKGNVIGEHKGIVSYTIGQRKGLGISASDPHYVIAVKPNKNTVIVGSRRETMRKSLKIKELNWVSIESPTKPIKVMLKMRSTMKEVPATIIPEKNQEVTVQFNTPEWAPAPGQSAVFYNNDMVLGGGIIE